MECLLFSVFGIVPSRRRGWYPVMARFPSFDRFSHVPRFRGAHSSRTRAAPGEPKSTPGWFAFYASVCIFSNLAVNGLTMASWAERLLN